MPRVHTKTRSTRVTKRPYRCTGCGEEIVAGEKYYEWEKRYGGPQRRHVACGYPRPTQLSNRKTAQIDEAVQDMSLPYGELSIVVDGWDGTTEQFNSEAEGYVSDLTQALADVAQVVRDVGQEYQDSFDNLPENFQYGSTGEALQTVAEELESKADDLESWEPSSTEPDWPERDDDESLEDFAGRVEEAFQNWASDAQSEAEDACSDMPEYQG
jgi:gas vesicle protein